MKIERLCLDYQGKDIQSCSFIYVFHYKIIIAVVIFILVLNRVFFLRISGPSSPSGNTTASQNSILFKPITTPPPNSNIISESVLAQHDTQEDCWISYKRKVYDITSYLSRHPGGVSTISRYCGTSDKFEQAFAMQHGTKMAGMLVKVAAFMGDFSVQGAAGN